MAGINHAHERPGRRRSAGPATWRFNLGPNPSAVAIFAGLARGGVGALINKSPGCRLFSGPKISGQLPGRAHDDDELYQPSMASISSGPPNWRLCGRPTGQPASHLIERPRRRLFSAGPVRLSGGANDAPATPSGATNPLVNQSGSGAPLGPLAAPANRSASVFISFRCQPAAQLDVLVGGATNKIDKQAD